MAQGNYEGISIRDAMDRINATNNGWYLPNIQRQYVWGSRDSSEEYICLLVDSLLRGFPIGGLVLWETDTPIPYREFLRDYEVGSVAKIVAEERWGNTKSLVYDGQQRLQTLYSILHHRFNGRVLYYDLLFDMDSCSLDETGFFFKSKDEPAKPFSISMPEISGQKNREDKYRIRDKVINAQILSNEQKMRIEINLDKLWSVFVERENRSIAYFPVKSSNSAAVNEVFRRLNTGGIPLTQLEMVLAKIKEHSPYFEEMLWDLTGKIKEATGGVQGYEFSAHEIVQLIYLLIFKTTRVDEGQVNDSNICDMINMFSHVQKVLPEFFKYFIYEGFRINAKWLIIRQQALLPLLVYCVTLECKGHKWKVEQIDSTALITYFIKSQLCDWNTQTMVTSFARLAYEAAKNNTPFPLEAITNVAVEKNRTSDVFFYQLEGPIWFSLKILTPNRLYLFNERKPQIDHIYPQALHDKCQDKDEYRQRVDVIWNMQPTPAGVNNHKRMAHPVNFFKSSEGRPYLASYDFIPSSLDSEEWKNEKDFVAFRKKQMVDFMKNHYGIELKENP